MWNVIKERLTRKDNYFKAIQYGASFGLKDMQMREYRR
jgi:hypothetical protein